VQVEGERLRDPVLVVVGGLQPASQSEDPRGDRASGPRRPVSLHQPAGPPVPSGSPARHFRRYEEEGTGGGFQSPGRPVAPERPARAGPRARLRHPRAGQDHSLDRGALLASVRKTGRLVVAHEAWGPCGVGAEVAALVAEHALNTLKAPVRRVVPPFTPVPFSPPMEPGNPVTTGRDSLLSRGVTASHRVTGNPSQGITAPRGIASFPSWTSPADRGGPLHCRSRGGGGGFPARPLIERWTAPVPPHKTRGETRGESSIRADHNEVRPHEAGGRCTRSCTRRGAGTRPRGPTRSNETRENSLASVGGHAHLRAWPRPVKPEAAGSSPVGETQGDRRPGEAHRSPDRRTSSASAVTCETKSRRAPPCPMPTMAAARQAFDRPGRGRTAAGSVGPSPIARKVPPGCRRRRPKNFATNFATIAHHNPSHPITIHPRRPGGPDMSYPVPGAGIRA